MRDRAREDHLGYECGLDGVPELRRGTTPQEMNEMQLSYLFASCMPRLLRAAQQVLRDPQDSVDALQDGLLQAFRKLHQFQGRSKFSTWLHSIVRNAARTHLRQMRCRPHCSWEEELTSGDQTTVERLSVNPGPNPEEECARREMSRILREAAKKLPSRYRSAIELCDVQGADPRDAARRLGITQSALKTYLFRARRWFQGAFVKGTSIGAIEFIDPNRSLQRTSICES
jgi:RNA polymerase sigma factor (sigma-70 family)